MPELPEVEIIVRSLRPQIEGRRITGVRLGKTDFIAQPAALESGLPGCRIAQVSRVGKFIRMELEPANGAPPAHLWIHLGMTGRMLAQPAGAAAPRHTHVFLELDDGREIQYTDPRRFGTMRLLGGEAERELRARLGPDALEISLEDFRSLLGGRSARIKALLLDQRRIGGVGNIYADESLWLARVHPLRAARDLSRAQAAALHRALRRVLREAIRLRGSSISDFVDALGEPGQYQLRHRVYGREGKSCLRCGARIRRVIVAGRSSHVCPRCQRAPR